MVVIIIRVVEPETVPDCIVGVVKLGVEAAGRPDAEKFTGVASAPPCVPKFTTKLAVCPAGTVTGACGPVTEKSFITKLIEFEPPPPGVGLDTVTPTDLAVASSVAAMVAVSVVPLFDTVPA